MIANATMIIFIDLNEAFDSALYVASVAIKATDDDQRWIKLYGPTSHASWVQAVHVFMVIYKDKLYEHCGGAPWRSG